MGSCQLRDTGKFGGGNEVMEVMGVLKVMNVGGDKGSGTRERQVDV